MVANPVVFCSHTSADKPRVLAFADRLRADGFDPWVDRMEISGGDDFVAKINDGLARASAGLIFFSRQVDASLWVRAEVNFLVHQAVAGALRVVPVMIDDDAAVPPLLVAYHRWPITAYEQIRDDLLGVVRRQVPAAMPDRTRQEVLVQLTGSGDNQVRSRVWLSGAELADVTARLPALLATSYVPPLTDPALAEVGRACGGLLFPAGVAEPVAAALREHRRPGDRLDVVVEAEPELLRLPLETARLPSPGLPLLVGLDGVTLLRRPLGGPARLTPALPPPLKILAVVAAPDEDSTASVVLDGERELARILAAVPEHGAQVRPLEVASLEQITAALTRDEYHVLHLSGHGGAAGIELEDEDGRATLVAPGELAAAITAAERQVPLVFLSCCDPATGRGSSRGLAERLLEAGLSQVVAMQGNVSDRYAIELAGQFYAVLAGAPDREPAAALAAARRAVERERQKALTQGVKMAPEFATATMFCVGAPQPVVGAGEPRPLTQRPAVVAAGPVPLLGVDDLVGRRREVRTAVRALTDPRHRGVALYGMGGVGKSTVAGRVMQRMRERGWTVATVAGPLSVTGLRTAVRDALDEIGDPDAARLVTQLSAETADEQLQIARLCRAVREHRLLLVLDNFEDNLIPGGEAFGEPSTAALTASVAAAATTGRLLVTSRYPIPEIEGLAEVRVTPLSPAQARKLLLRLPGLDGLDADQARELLAVTGGHPRLLELVDAAVRGDTGRLRSMTERLRRFAEAENIDLTVARDQLAQAVQDAVTVALRDIALTDLLAEVAPHERDALMQVAVSTIPVGTSMLADLLDQTGDLDAVLRRLTRFALLTPVGDGWFVERWTAQGLRAVADPAQWQTRSRAAAARRLQPNLTGKIDLADAMEAVRNLIAADELDQAARQANNICLFLQGQRQLVALAAFAGDCLAHLPLSLRDTRLVAEAEADANLALGFTAAT